MKNKVDKQSQWWKYAAGTIPFVCSAILVLLDFIGWQNLHNKVVFVILITFFATGVLWWWWAVDKIVFLTNTLMSTEKEFLNLKKEINSIQEDIKSLDERNKI